jgi:hypothetical protein
MTKKHRTTTVIVLVAHIAVLAILLIRGATAKVDSPPYVPLDVTVSFESRSVDVSSPLPEELSAIPSDSLPEEPKQHTRQQIIPSTNRVIRNISAPTTPTPPAEQIASELLASLASSSITPPTEIQRGNHDAEILREAFHSPWIPPPRHIVGDAKVIARVTFGPDGTVRSTSLESRSGIPSFDSSVNDALQQVTKVAGLSEITLQKSDGVTFEFSVAK